MRGGIGEIYLLVVRILLNRMELKEEF